MTAIIPAMSGAVEEPTCSKKLCRALAILRTSGSVMSYTVVITLAEAIGINRQANASREPFKPEINRDALSIGRVSFEKSKLSFTVIPTVPR